MYLFYVDESGNRDPKVDEPYVLVAAGMCESHWHDFNEHLMEIKNNIARKHNLTIRQDQLEVKANLLTKLKARRNNPFFEHLTSDEITRISTEYYDQLEHAKVDIIAVVIDKGELNQNIKLEDMHSKAYSMLLEQVRYHMANRFPDDNALIIMDDTGAQLNRKITLMHATLLGIVDYRNIIEFPFFVSSELSNGVQLADLIAFSIYHTFKHNKPDYKYLDKILPRISKDCNKFGNPNILTGLVIWPYSARFGKTFDAMQLNHLYPAGK